jgi:hypothetical protein
LPIWRARCSAVAVNGGGFADTPNQRILIDPGASATDAKAMPTRCWPRGNGGTVRIGDVADVAMPPRRALAMR